MRNKYVAGWLALCFGWLGFHKFYLWKWIQWIFYILLWATFIPLILSILEWILYLVNSQEWFDKRYNFEEIKKDEYFNKQKNNGN